MIYLHLYTPFSLFVLWMLFLLHLLLFLYNFLLRLLLPIIVTPSADGGEFTDDDDVVDYIVDDAFIVVDSLLGFLYPLFKK